MLIGGRILNSMMLSMACHQKKKEYMHILFLRFSKKRRGDIFAFKLVKIRKSLCLDESLRSIKTLEEKHNSTS